MRYRVVCTSFFMAPYPDGMAPSRRQAVGRARFGWRHIANAHFHRMLACNDPADRRSAHGARRFLRTLYRQTSRQCRVQRQRSPGTDAVFRATRDAPHRACRWRSPTYRRQATSDQQAASQEQQVYGLPKVSQARGLGRQARVGQGPALWLRPPTFAADAAWRASGLDCPTLGLARGWEALVR